MHKITLSERMKRLFYLFFVLSAACTNKPGFPIEPKIEYIGMTKSSMVQSSVNGDSTLIRISFTDGDGDLGDKDSLNLIVTDSRIPGFPEKFKIPFVPIEGSGNGISGEIGFLVYSTCCIYPDGSACFPSTQYPTDSLHYFIKIKDRAGHWSNEIRTNDLVILCQ